MKWPLAQMRIAEATEGRNVLTCGWHPGTRNGYGPRTAEWRMTYPACDNMAAREGGNRRGQKDSVWGKGKGESSLCLALALWGE